MFVDDIPEWVRSDVERIVRAGFMSGYLDGTWRGDQYLTRNEVAKILSRLMSKGSDLADADLREVALQVASAVVEVRSGSGLGSGVIVSTTGHVLTNAHVVGDSASCEIVWRSVMLEGYPDFIGPMANVVAVDAHNDLALLNLNWQGAGIAVPEIAHDWLDLKKTNVEHFGRSLFMQGSPLGFGGRITRGIFNGIRRLNGQTYLDIDGHINPGNSGGPIFDGSGRLVGLVVAKLVDVEVEGFGLGIPLHRIVPFLQAYGIHTKGV